MTYKNQPTNEYETAVGTTGQLVDVREPAEYESGTLPGAINIPLGELPGRLGELDSTRRIVLLCRSGARSTHAAEYLAQAGFADVVNLEGGLLNYEPDQQPANR